MSKGVNTISRGDFTFVLADVGLGSRAGISPMTSTSRNGDPCFTSDQPFSSLSYVISLKPSLSLVTIAGRGSIMRIYW